MSVADRVRIHSVETLSDNWYVLKKATFDFLRSDGTWQRQSRESYDQIFEAFMSPGSVTEKLYFFIAEYETDAKRETGGGLVSEGEDISTLELDLDAALQMILSGEIKDGKTIMLLQYAKLYLFPAEKP